MVAGRSRADTVVSLPTIVVLYLGPAWSLAFPHFVRQPLLYIDVVGSLPGADMIRKYHP